MSLLRAFHAGALPNSGSAVSLDLAESRHLTRVRRARLGDRVQLLDGVGGVATGQIVGDDPDGTRVHCQAVARHPFPVPRVLAVGLPKGSLIEDIIRQATELGATALQPLLTAHTENRLDDPSRLAHKLVRWRTNAIEGCKQSGNPWLPEIYNPVDFNAWLLSTRRSGSGWQRFVAALTPNSIPFLQHLTRLPPGTAGFIVAIGPEGDFSPEEYADLSGAAFSPIRLPGRVLRVETACAAALAILGAHQENS